ncbi:MAG: hypothetical protein HC810_08460 [Acaryochloridaceae cyanobacterium RL_2_7]|nr:hypothetical protein [Acaryochloridaceae cyanobacterium RL_2_7]
MTEAYVPFLYVIKFKHNLKYFLNGILMDQWLILVLASSWISSQPVLHASGLLFLIGSFWCIYELGYYENDDVAERYEKNPNLKETTLTRPKPSVLEPWIWAIVLAVPGFLMLQAAMASEPGFTMQTAQNGIFLRMALCWLSILIAMRLIYRAFNYVDKRTRVWLYVLLQYSRLPAFTLLITVSPAGVTLISAQTLVSWIRYIVYRYQGNMNEIPHAVLRLSILCFLMAMLAIGNGISAIVSWQMAAILMFCLLRSMSTLPQLFRQIKSVSNDNWNS